MANFSNQRGDSWRGPLFERSGRLAQWARKGWCLGVCAGLAMLPLPTQAFASSEPAQQKSSVNPHSGAYRSMLVLPLRVEGVVPRRVKERYERASLEALKSEHFETIVVSDCEDVACAVRKAPQAKRPVVLSQVLTAKERNYTLTVELLDGRSGRVLTTSKENCDLCGVGEVSELFVARASVIKDKIESTDAFGSTLEVNSDPPGAEIFVDGELMGQTPASLQLSSGQHSVELRKKGHSPSRKKVSIVNGVKESLEFSLPKILVAPKRDPRLDQRPNAISASGWGWLGIGVGALGVAAGTTLMVLHDRPFTPRCDKHPTDPSLSDVDADGDCRYRYDTQGGGIIALSVGGAMLVAGVTVVAIQMARKKKARSKSKVAWSPAQSGLGLRF